MIGFLGIGKHNRLRTLLSAYIDGEVGEAESKRVEEHLAGCRECVLELESLRATVGLLRELPELAVPRSYVLTEASAPLRVAYRLIPAAGLATSAAALLLVALLVGDVTDAFKQRGTTTLPNRAVLTRVVEQEEAVAEEAVVEKEVVKEVVVEKQVVKEVAVERGETEEEAETARAAPLAAAVESPTPSPLATQAPPSAKASATPAVAAVKVQEDVGDGDASRLAEESKGLEMPLRELEVAAAAAFLALTMVTFWMVRRRSSRVP